MTIKFSLFGNTYEIAIGHHTPWFGQIALITVIKLDYDNEYNVNHAELIFEFPKTKI